MNTNTPILVWIVIGWCRKWYELWHPDFSFWYEFWRLSQRYELWRYECMNYARYELWVGLLLLGLLGILRLYSRDSNCHMWQSLSPLYPGTDRDSNCQMWQQLSYVTAIVTRHSNCHTWQQLSQVTAIVTSDSNCHKWQQLSHVTVFVTFFTSSKVSKRPTKSQKVPKVT